MKFEFEARSPNTALHFAAANRGRGGHGVNQRADLVFKEVHRRLHLLCLRPKGNKGDPLRIFSYDRIRV